MELVCLDTHIIIWGIKEEATPGQEEMVSRAKAFFKHLDDNGAKAIIPAVVVGELLMRVPPELHQTVTNLLDMKFMVASFDAAAASCFAKIWQKNGSSVEQIMNGLNYTREELKADCQIVAIAVVKGASCIYSYDEKLKRFAKGFIEVRELPVIPVQTDLNLPE